MLSVSSRQRQQSALKRNSQEISPPFLSSGRMVAKRFISAVFRVVSGFDLSDQVSFADSGETINAV
jgi:hypothetical protein